MISLRRTAVVPLAALLVLLALGSDSAFSAEEKTTAEADGPLGLTIDPRAGLQLAAAADYIGEEDWKNAVRLLQHLLDDKSESLARVAGRQGKADRYVSVHTEAERLLAEMPQAGREVYQRTAGPRAAELLEQARKERNAELLSAIVRRYLYTEIGPSALEELARRHYRAGRLHFAAYSYARLVEHLGLARWTSDDLYRATVAFQQRSTSTYADRTLAQLLARSRQNVVRLGARALSVEQLRTEIERAIPSRSALDWPVHGGDAGRTAQGSGGAPFLEPIWRQSMFWGEIDGKEDPVLGQRLRQAEKLLQERHRPLVPAFSPITVTLARGGRKIPLLIYKNYWGIVALNAKTKEIVWAAPSSWSLQRMLSPRGDSAKQHVLDEWLRFYFGVGNYPQIVFDNSTVGTLTTDGKYVYALEDLAVPPHPNDLADRFRLPNGEVRYSGDLQDAVRRNRLQVFSLAAGGKLFRELGEDEKGPLEDCYFLGPPLPLDGLLYMLIEKKQQLCLLCIDPGAKFKIVSLRPLLRVPAPLSEEPYRRIRAAHVAYGDGILVCPSNDGAILGIDLLSGSVAWAYPYRETAATPRPGNAERSVPRRARPVPNLPEQRATPPAAPPLVVRPFSWSWKGWKMWGSDALVVANPGKQRVAAVPEQVWKHGDIPPGWLVGPHGRSVPFRRPLTMYEVYNRAFGKGGSLEGQEVAAEPPASERREKELPAGWMRDAEGRIVREHPQPYWTASAPVIAEGKVVFAPPDSPTIHCVNLHDGSLVWSRKKKEDELYLGGVYHGKALIVSTSSVQGISLASGATLWTLPTGTPSGRGIAGKAMYYLPLKESIHSKQPEICVLDIDKGRVVAHIKSRPRTPGGTDFEVPGNLLFHGGELISLTPWEVVAYPPLKGKIDQVSNQLAQHPNDPAALTERAALHLADGDATGAVEDLRNALMNKPVAAIRHRARSLLFEALTEMFQRDLRDADKYLTEYEEATHVELDGVPAGEQARRKAEQDRRRVRYHLLVARLRESQGRPIDALKAYLDLAALGPGEDMVPLPDEPAVKVRRAVWVRGRIAELIRRGTPAQREELDKVLLRRLKELEGRKEVRSLRDFAALFGTDTAGGREAALRLAERLMQQRDYLEAELLLQQVRRHHDDSARAARAVEMLGRLMTLEGLLPDAVYYYRILRRDFGKTKLPDGNTGADVWDALSADKRFLPYLEETDPLALGKFKARKEAGSFPLNDPLFQFEHDGEDVPFFRRHLVGLGMPDPVFHLRDRSSGEDRWTQRLQQTSFQALLPGLDPKAMPRFRYHTLGHLIVLPVDRMVFVLDPVERRVLWEKDTFAEKKKTEADSPALGVQRWATIVVDPLDGSTRVAYADGWVQHLGQHLVLSRSALCLSTRRGLQAFEPRTGQLLWSRADVPSNLRIFGDEEYVFLVQENAKGEVISTRVLRLADGGSVPARDFANLFRKRLQVFGRTLLLSEKDDKEAVTLRQYDIPTGADVWKATYPPKSLVLHSDDARWTGAVEPDGKVHVVDLRSRKEVMTGQMDKDDFAKHLRGVEIIHLLADRKYFYLACQAQMDINNSNRRDDVGVQANVMIRHGMRGVPVNGYLYAFERGSGEWEWFALVKDQFLILDQFADLPVIFLTSRAQPLGPIPEGRASAPRVRVTVVTKRSGSTIFFDDALKEEKPFYAVRFDAQTGMIEFISPKLKIRCQALR